MTETRKKLVYLESLRGIAALMVVFTHFAGTFFPAISGGGQWPQHSPLDLWIYKTPLSVFIGGNFAVCVFFVLSGFVLTRAFFASGRREILTNAAFKRYFRLMPPVAISVMMAYTLLHFHLFFNQDLAALTGSAGIRELWTFPADFGSAVAQAFYGAFVDGTVGGSAYNPVLWTMQVEFIGSFLVFGLAGVFGGQPRRWWAYILMAVVTWHTYYLGFVFGLVLADLSTSAQMRARVDQQRWFTWAGLLVIGLLLGGYPSSGSTSDTWYALVPNLVESPVQAIATWHTLAAALVVVSVLGWRRSQHFLEWKPFVALGRQSFGLYLTHLMIISTFSAYLFKNLIISYGYRMSFAVTFVASLAVIFAVSYLYARWVDQPAIVMSNWLVRRVTGQAKRPAPHSAAAPVQAAPYATISAVEGSI